MNAETTTGETTEGEAKELMAATIVINGDTGGDTSRTEIDGG